VSPRISDGIDIDGGSKRHWPPSRLPAKSTFSANGVTLGFRFAFVHAELAPIMNVWDKLTRVVVALIVTATFVAVVLWFTPLFQQNQRMRTEKLALDQKIAREVETSKKIDAQAKALQDPRTVERLARERLSYARPGEIVVHFESPQTNSPSSSYLNGR
jgi:cell division protein FtsB